MTVGRSPRTAASQAQGLLFVVAGGEHLEPPAVVRVELKRRDRRHKLHAGGGLCLAPGRCEPCNEAHRRQQVQDFKRQLQDKAQAAQQSKFQQWHFPHRGDEGKWCGVKVFNAHENPTGPSHFWAIEPPCRNRDCPKCGPEFNAKACEKPKCTHDPCKAGAWEIRIAGQWQREIEWWMRTQEAEALAIATHQRKLPVVHFLVSVHPKDWDKLPEHEKTRETLDQLRTASHRYAKRAGMVGAYWAMHGQRVPTKWNQRSCKVDGLHFHYVGITNRIGGYVDGGYVAKLHKRRGWILKRIGKQDSFFGTALYQLSHATWAEYDDGQDAPDDAGELAAGYPALVHNSQTGRSCGRIGWFLGLSSLAPPVVLEEEICAVCGHDIPPSMRFEVWRLADAPPPASCGDIDWAHWTDTPPEPGAAALAEYAADATARKGARDIELATRCKCNGGPAPRPGCCSGAAYGR